MRRRFTRSLVILGAVGILFGLFPAPANASEPVCTPGIDPLTITVAGQDIPVHEGVAPVCADLPDKEELPDAEVYQDYTGAYHIVVYNTGSYSSRCMFGVNGSCWVWLDRR